MSPGLIYLDSCVTLMFVNVRDDLRNNLDLGRKRIDNFLPRGTRYHIPMVSLGEVFHKIREKNPKGYDEPLDELNRLLDSGFLQVRYIGDPYSTFTLARTISKKTPDARDQISPMDAFIIASATTDRDCSTICTSDKRLVTNANVQDAVSEWRENNGLPPIKMLTAEDAFGSKYQRRFRVLDGSVKWLSDNPLPSG